MIHTARARLERTKMSRPPGDGSRQRWRDDERGRGIEKRATDPRACDVACRDVNDVVAFGDARGVIVVLRSFASIVSSMLAVRHDDVEVVPIRPQRDRMAVVASVDPQRERARNQRRSECRLSDGTAEQQVDRQYSNLGRFHGSRGSAAPIGGVSLLDAFGCAIAGP